MRFMVCTKSLGNTAIAHVAIVLRGWRMRNTRIFLQNAMANGTIPFLTDDRCAFFVCDPNDNSASSNEQQQVYSFSCAVMCVKSSTVYHGIEQVAQRTWGSVHDTYTWMDANFGIHPSQPSTVIVLFNLLAPFYYCEYSSDIRYAREYPHYNVSPVDSLRKRISLDPYNPLFAKCAIQSSPIDLQTAKNKLFTIMHKCHLANPLFKMRIKKSEMGTIMVHDSQSLRLLDIIQIKNVVANAIIRQGVQYDGHAQVDIIWTVLNADLQ